jgi:hypothetical protein
MRVDPLLAPPNRTVFGGFSWGYGGGGPSALYDALLRVGCKDALGFDIDFRPLHDSRLWEVITTAKGPLRIAWPDLRRWAAHDAEHVHRNQ